MMLKSPHFWKVWLPPHIMAGIGLAFFHNSYVFLAFLVFYSLISGLGIAVGYHRYFSHKAFQTNKFWQITMLYWGRMACQGSPVFWIALHRGLHHRYADTTKDPHSPVHNTAWMAYQGYSFNAATLGVPLRAAADFLRNKVWMRYEADYVPFLWTSWFLYGAVSWYLGAPEVFVGLTCAQVWAIHQEALVNLLGHTGGLGAYRNHETEDRSVNRPLLGLFTWGQALHNNHHASAGEADFGNRWYELDPSMLWVKAIRTK